MAVAQDCIARNDDEGLFGAIPAAIIESYRADARLERVLLFAALEGNEQGLAHYRNFSIPIRDLLRDYIVRRQRDGALTDHNPVVILAAIAGMAHRYAQFTQFFGFPAEASDEETVAAFTRILMNGIKAK